MSGYDAFAPVYDVWASGMVEDIGFYADLVREADGPVVELAVGTGRVAIPAAQRTGKRIVGIDSSPEMLAVARERAAAIHVELELREGDMRELAPDQAAALVYCPARSLLHLPTWSDRRRAFDAVAAGLRPGGRFAWNAFVFDHRIAAQLDGNWRDEPIRHRNMYSPAESRIDIELEHGPRVSLWWATKNEWLGLIEISGLEVDALYGWFDRRPFNAESREFVWVARRPG